MKKLFTSSLMLLAAMAVNGQRIENGVLYINEGTTETVYAEYQKNAEIRDIHFPNSLSQIGYLSFNNVPGLTSITIPSTVDTICGWAFSECANLRKVVIEDGVSSIKECAFYKAMVDTFVIPNSVTEILPWALSSDGAGVVCCEYGSTAYEFARNEGFHVHITNIPEHYWADLRAIELDGESEVADSFFYNRQNLEYVRFSYGLQRIGTAALRNTGVRNLDLPSSITYIGEDAFDAECTLRCVAGSYAENWLIEHGYRLNGVLSDLHEYTLNPEVVTDQFLPEGVVTYSWKQFEKRKAVLQKDETVSDMVKYGFIINRPVNLRRDGDSLEITSFYLHPLENAYLGVQTDSFKPLVYFDQIPPLTQIRIPIPENAESGKFDVKAQDSLYNVIRSIQMTDSITFGKTTVREGDEYSWEVLSPIQAREWINMFTNMCYVMSLREFEDKLYSYADRCYDDAEGKILIGLDGLKQLYQNIINKKHSELRRCGAGAWGLAYVPGDILGLTDWALMQHYQDNNNYSAAFHEFSHNMGYGHDGNMTTGKKPLGKEDDPNEEYVGFETAAYTIYQEHQAQDRLVYNDVNLLNSYDMYATDVTCDSPLKSRIAHYGEPKGNGPSLELGESLSLADSVSFEATFTNSGAYFSNLLRTVILSENTGDTVASYCRQYMSLEPGESKTKAFSLGDDSLASGNYRVEMQYWNSFVGEWQLPEPQEWAVLEWRWNNPLLPELPTVTPEIDGALACVAYPNPTTDVLNVQTNKVVKSLQVLNMDGRLMCSANGCTQIDVRNLPSGIYLLKVVTTEGETLLKVAKAQ